ncbi:DoxX family protein [Pseudalkalibacillus salsuginis]|uniref:DoxX family protein n=1 Tax=Pseudalkalibacillus salsuginis TaxID=2910972 RepID=UPI001CD1A365|nr:DoxX family protein [Pseudalkalibacillus salsuginis]MCF6411426.1 DoxX family protein [Pseudalkalibacillus salsuginis]
MRKLIVTYWICTGLLALLMGVGSLPNILSSAESIALFQQLGYPAYLLPFLGVAKLLGVIAIILPGFPRIKEWAYAGLTFDLAGATYSFIAIGTPIEGILMILGFLMIAGSYVTHHIIRKAKMAGQVTERTGGVVEEA